MEVSSKSGDFDEQPEMLKIPGGAFTMGCQEGHSGLPVRFGTPL